MIMSSFGLAQRSAAHYLNSTEVYNLNYIILILSKMDILDLETSLQYIQHNGVGFHVEER